MTTYCRNGHEQTGNVTIANIETGAERCPTCRALLSEYVQPDDAPRWPVVLTVLVALLLVGAWWWWLWLAPR